ncbi:nuclear transport factor 2 family protein [Temperatibacter marinus]|uniref:Nuclear transport factor 2 family protein n=1 Tax=Temperatibacter marinus TaxID=1456591 RepID=A0AA52EFS0_9PROT|nr:nuclear transport factor 2 family protein [Temperatibacter marinus]WND01714.1 nuclear transport factor 2 family protein [Temperatibacter marinus]
MTMQDLIKDWHTIVKTRNMEALKDLLAEEATMISPVVHTPQVGKDITFMYLAAAVNVFGNDHFNYVRELVNDTSAVLEFETEINGIYINGVDMIKWNEDGKIIEFKVMIRPLQGLNLIHEMMGQLLQTMKQD